MNIKSFLLLFAVILLASCRNENNAQTTVATASQEKSTTLTFKSKGINSIYATYTSLRDALVATDFETVKKYAQELQQAISTDESAKENESIVAAIVSSKNISDARKEFSKLNLSIENLFRVNIQTGEINKAYCPMANNNKGAFWFTSDKEILNPYFGDQMLKCGMIKETIVSK